MSAVDYAQITGINSKRSIQSTSRQSCSPTRMNRLQLNILIFIDLLTACIATLFIHIYSCRFPVTSLSLTTYPQWYHLDRMLPQIQMNMDRCYSVATIVFASWFQRALPTATSWWKRRLSSTGEQYKSCHVFIHTVILQHDVQWINLQCQSPNWGFDFQSNWRRDGLQVGEYNGLASPCHGVMGMLNWRRFAASKWTDEDSEPGLPSDEHSRPRVPGDIEYHKCTKFTQGDKLSQN